MDFSSLDVKILLRLMKFLSPEDRFNLVLSGVLKGFENANEGIDIRHRYSEHFTCSVQWYSNCYIPRIGGIGIELGQHRDSTSQLEIR
jgi:hypothetical protein